MGASLELDAVRHRRGRREVLGLPALSVPPGGRLAVLGPNGSGKTTLLRLLAGFERPTTGRVLLDGTDATRLTVHDRRRTAYVTQQPALLSTTVLRNVELPLAWRKVPRLQRRDLAVRALRRLGVAHLAHRDARRLSSGERQRVSLARALTTDPALLLLDEPAAALDVESRAGFLGDIEDALADHAPTVVHVSHRPAEAMRGADTVAVLVDGRMHQLGPPGDVVRAPADPTVARLVGYDNVVDARVDADGSARVDGHVVLRGSSEPPGRTQLAVWGWGVRLGPTSGETLCARVLSVTPGQGRWEVRLAGSVSLLAYLPLHRPAPAVGDRVGLVLDPEQAVAIPPSGAVPAVRPAESVAPPLQEARTE